MPGLEAQYRRALILILAEIDKGQQLASLLNQRCSCIPPDPEELAKVLLQQEPEAIILHRSSAAPQQNLIQLLLQCGSPLIVVLQRTAEGAQVAADLAALGVRHFRFENETSDWNRYLFQILDAHRRRGILQSAHEYLESLHVVQMERTRSVLDSLQMGLMVIEGAVDGQLMHYNHRLELLLNRELDVWHGWSLNQIQEHLKEEESSDQSLFRLPVQVSNETISDFFQRGPLYLERTILPLISASEVVTGFLFVFRDVTFEVSSDRLDAVTGLPTNSEVARILSRRVAWTLRHSGIPCRHISAAHIRLDNMDSYREHQGKQAVEQLLIEAASQLRLCSSDSMVIVRSGISDFLIYAVDHTLEQCSRKQREIQERLGTLVRTDGQAVQLQAGWAVRRLNESDYSDPSRMEDGLRRAFRDTLRTAEKALQGAIRDKSAGMLYSAEEGFIPL